MDMMPSETDLNRARELLEEYERSPVPCAPQAAKFFELLLKCAPGKETIVREIIDPESVAIISLRRLEDLYRSSSTRADIPNEELRADTHVARYIFFAEYLIRPCNFFNLKALT
jgi:hypothetical protein